MSCSICCETNKRLYCGACTSHLTLRARVNVVKVELQLSALERSVENAVASPNSGTEAHTELLNARIASLQQRIERIQQATLVCQNETLQLRKQTKALENQGAAARSAANQRHKMDSNARNARLDHVSSYMGVLEEKYVLTFKSSLSLQSRCCQDLLDVFSLKKKRRRLSSTAANANATTPESTGGYEIVLGFNVIPELTQLGHYSLPVINSGVERVAYFSVLLANYLGIRLPCHVDLPQKNFSRLRIGGKEVYLPHSVKTMMRSAPREFYTYCRGLAMLSLNVALLAAKLGIPPVMGAPIVARIGQLVAQIYLRIEGLIKAGHQIQVHTASVGADVDTLQDQLITLIDVEMNGNSAEWNVVDPPSRNGRNGA